MAAPPPPPHSSSHVDLEQGGGGGGGRHSSAATADGAGELSRTPSGGPRKSASSGSEIVAVVCEKRRESSASEVSVEMVDLESTGKELHLGNFDRDCRICHLSLDATNQECGGIPIELGCSCKDDLAAAHKQCAEAWFKIRGNKICEICGSTARNVSGANEAELMEQWNESNDAATSAANAAVPTSETRNFWQGHRFLNFLLACMVFAFVISWLFHFNVPS